MATTPTLMYRGTLTALSGSQLYSAPATGTSIVTNIALSNTATSGITATISLLSGSTNYPILSSVNISPATTAFFDVKQVLNGTSNAITGYCSVSGSITAHISGVVIV
jgi:hypothetical protein